MLKTMIAGLVLAASAFALPNEAAARGGGGGRSSSSHSPISTHSGGSHVVHSYTTKNGTYVASHYATNPNSSKSDNWSTKGNVNPHTGKAGTKNPW
jgi:uncharacterized membrane protein